MIMEKKMETTIMGYIRLRVYSYLPLVEIIDCAQNLCFCARLKVCAA